MTTFSCVVALIAGIKSFHKRFVITDHVRISLKVMTKVFDSKVQSERFSGKRGVLALRRRKAFRERRDWTPCVVNALHDGSATAEV